MFFKSNAEQSANKGSVEHSPVSPVLSLDGYLKKHSVQYFGTNKLLVFKNMRLLLVASKHYNVQRQYSRYEKGE
ncbi:unnamed protein product [Toxocara canis]|uniref:Transposase n=1 Tax=Toxocara canis TaxID=6265 RepID=A0A183V563_TOXCA|nr:unnamed protein product [Toxocara canis]